jgi:hypothetical protein
VAGRELIDGRGEDVVQLALKRRVVDLRRPVSARIEVMVPVVDGRKNLVERELVASVGGAAQLLIGGVGGDPVAVGNYRAAPDLSALAGLRLRFISANGHRGAHEGNSSGEFDIRAPTGIRSARTTGMYLYRSCWWAGRRVVFTPYLSQVEGAAPCHPRSTRAILTGNRSAQSHADRNGKGTPWERRRSQNCW